MIAYFRRSALDKWLYFGASFANSCRLCPEQTVFSGLYTDTIFINTPSMKWKELQKQSWANAVGGRLLIEEMADAVKCLLSPLETPVLNLGWSMGYPDPGVRNLLDHSQTTTQIVR